MVRSLQDHLVDMDVLDNKKVTGKHLGRKGLHLNKADFSRLAKSIIYKSRKF